MSEMVKTTLNNEFEIIIPKHRADRPDWYTAEGWERPRLKHMSQNIGKGDVVYYVGAEEGEFPALCQMWGAEVVMFEPNPKVWPNIKAIWEANKLSMPMGCFDGFASNVTSADGHAHLMSKKWPIHVDEPVIGNHGFKELYLEADNYPQIKLDDVPEISGFKPPTMITFDCEGSDWEVMKGAEELLKKHRPIIYASIHPEFMFHQFGQYSRDFRNWLIGFGYRETFLDWKHEAHFYYEAIND